MNIRLSIIGSIVVLYVVVGLFGGHTFWTHPKVIRGPIPSFIRLVMAMAAMVVVVVMVMVC